MSSADQVSWLSRLEENTASQLREIHVKFSQLEEEVAEVPQDRLNDPISSSYALKLRRASRHERDEGSARPEVSRNAEVNESNDAAVVSV